MQKIYHQLLTVVAFLVGIAAFAQPTVDPTYGGGDICSGDNATFSVNTDPNGSGATTPFTLYYSVNGGSAQSLVYNAFGSQNITVNNVTGATTLSVDSIIDNNSTLYTYTGETATITAGQVNPTPVNNGFTIVNNQRAEGDDFEFNYNFSGTAPFTVTIEVDNVLKTIVAPANSGVVAFNEAGINDVVDTYQIDFIEIEDNNGCESDNAPMFVGNITVNPKPEVVNYTLINGPNGGNALANTYCEGDDFQVNVEFTGNGSVNGVYDIIFTSGGVPVTRSSDDTVTAVNSGGTLLATITIPTTSISADVDAVTIDFTQVYSDLGSGVIVENNAPLDGSDFTPGTPDIYQSRSLVSTQFNDAGDNLITEICDEEELNLDIVSQNTQGTTTFNYDYNSVSFTGVTEVAGDEVSNLELTAEYAVGNNTVVVTQIQDEVCTYTPLANQTDNVIVNNKPTVTLTGASTLCETDIYVLNIAYNLGSPNFDFTYRITDGGGLNYTFPQIVNGTSGAVNIDPENYDGGGSSLTPGTTYSLIAVALTDDKGCTSDEAFLNESIDFEYQERPTASAVFADTEICSNEGTTLDFTLTGTPPFTLTLDSISNDGGGNQSQGTVSYTVNAVNGSVNINPSVNVQTVFTYNILTIQDAETCGNDFTAAPIATGNSLTVYPNPTLVSITQAEDSVCNNEKNLLDYTVTANGSGDYTISGTATDNLANVLPFSFSNGGSGSPFTFNLDAVAGLVSGRSYTVEFTSLEDNRNTAGTDDDCSVAISNTSEVHVFRLPNVNAFDIVESDNIANPVNTICFGEDAKLLFDIDAFGNTVLNVSRVSAVNPALDGNLTVNYPGLTNGPLTQNYPTQEFLVSPLDSVTYETVEIISTVGTVTCSRTVAFGPEPLHVNDLPVGEIALNTSEVCEDNSLVDVTVTITKGDDAAGFQYDIVNGANSITRIINNPIPRSRVSNNFAVTDSSYVYLRNLVSQGANPQCIGQDDSVFINVNPLPDVELLTPDTFICEGSTAGFRVAVTGVAPFDINVQAESAPATGNAETITVLNAEAGNYVNNREVFIPISGIEVGGDTAFTINSISDGVCVNNAPTDAGERVVIVVNKNPTLVIDAPAVVCFDVPNNLSTQVSGGNNNDFGLVQEISVDYTISYRNGGVFSSGTFTSIDFGGQIRSTPETFSLNNDTAFVVDLISDGTFGCAGVAGQEFEVIVSDEIVASISSPDTICNGENALVTVDLPFGFEYQLEFELNGTPLAPFTNVQDGDVLTILSAGAPSLDQIELVSVAYQNGLACQTTVNQVIEVLEKDVPAADIDINQNDIQVCRFTDASFTVSFTGGTGEIFLDYTSDVGNFSGTVSGLAGETKTVVVSNLPVGTYSFSRTRVYSVATVDTCEGMVAGGNTADVTVRDLPQVSFVPSEVQVCDSEDVIFQGSFTTVANSSATEYDIVYTINGGPDQTERLNPGIGNDAITINRAGSYSIIFKTITEVDGNGVNCPNAINQNFNITVNERPTVSLTGDATICEQVETPLDFVFTGTSPYTVVLSNFGTFTSSTDTTILVTPLSTTTYQVTSLTDGSASGCASAVTLPSATVTVIDKPNVTFNLSDNPICSGETVDIELAFAGGTAPEYRVTYQINNNAPIDHLTASTGGNLTIPLNAFNSDATISILEVRDASSPVCVFEEIQSIDLEVRETPDAVFTASATEICEGEDVQLSLQISGRVGETIDYQVIDETLAVIQTGTEPAGTTVNLPQQNALTVDKTYSLAYLRYTDGTPACDNPSATIDINVNEQPTINLTGNGIYCEGEPIPFTIEYVSGDGDIFVELQSPETGQTFTFNSTAGNTLPYTWTPTDTGAVSLTVNTITSVSGTGNVCQNAVNLPADINYTVRPLPSGAIDANQFTIVNGGQTQLIFSGVGYKGPGAGNTIIEFNENGVVSPDSPVNLDGNPQYPDTAVVQVSPTVTTTYCITEVNQNSGAVNGACAVNPNDCVEITVVDNKTAVISGDDDICLGECVDLFFSFENPVPNYTVIIEEASSGNLDTLTNVSDNTPVNYCPTESGSLQFTIFKTIDDLNNEESDPNEFAGVATIEVAETKNIVISGDTTVCENVGGKLFTITVDGSGEFTIPYAFSPSGAQSQSSISENDSPSDIQVPASVLRLGENTIDFNGTVTNSNNNACPIVQSGTARIFVKPIPTGDFTFTPQEPCEGVDVDVFLDAAPDSVYDISYNYDLGAGIISETKTGIQNGGLLEEFTASANGRFTLTSIGYSDAPACANNTVVQRNLNVKPAPVVAFINANSPTDICFGQSLDLVVRITNVDEYPVTFTYNDGTQDSTITFVNPNGFLDTVITVTPTTTTTYCLTDVFDANTPTCNGNVALGGECYTVNVGAQLLLSSFSVSTDTICQGETFTFTVDVTSGDFPMTAFFTGSEGSFTRTINAAGPGNVFPLTPTSDVTLTLDRIVDANNCELDVNQTRTVEVIQNPTLSFIPNKTDLCLGDSVRLRITVNAEDSVFALFRDPNFLAGGIDTTFKLSPGTQFVFLKPTQPGSPVIVTCEEVSYVQPRGGCTSEDVQSQALFVYDTPTASIFVGGDKDTIVCQNANVSLDFTSVASGTKTVFFQNDRGPAGFVSFTGTTGSTTVTPLVGLNKYYITRVDQNNNGTVCTTSDIMDTVYVEVAPTPTVEITATNNPRCLNGPNSVITFNFNGNGPFVFDYSDGTNTITRTASVDNDLDGRPDVQISVAPGTTTTYCVTNITDATSPTACVNNSTNCRTIVVNQQPEAELFNGSDEICFGEEVTLFYQVRGRAPIDVRFVYNGVAPGLPNVTGDTLIENVSTGINSLTIRFPEARDYIVVIDSLADNNNPQCTSGATLGFAEVIVNPIPSVNSFTLDNMRLCEGECTNLNIQPNSIGGFFDYPYEVTYLANGVTVVDTIEDQANSFVQVCPSTTTTYRLRSIRNINTGCDSTYVPSNPFVQTLQIFENPEISFQVDPSNVCVNDVFNLDVRITGTPDFLFDVYLNGTAFALNQSVVAADEDPANPGEYIKTFNYPGAPLPAAGFDESFVTIRNLRDGSQTVNLTPNACVTEPMDTAFFQVNPEATANFNDPSTITICEGEIQNYVIDITGSGTVFAVIDVRRTADNTLITRDTVSGLASAGTITYIDGPIENVYYEIIDVFSETGNVTCPGIPGNNKFVNVRNTPRMTISLDPSSTICEDDQVEVTYTIDGQGPFDFVRTIAEQGEPVITEEFFSINSPFVEFLTLSDTTVLYVDSIIRRPAPQCFTTDSVGRTINVNPKAKATFLRTDTTFCEGEQAGFDLQLEGQGAITVLYRSLPSGPIQTYSNFAGTYFIPVTQAAGTTARWQVISIDDESNPRCVEAEGRGFTDITIIQTPGASISGNFEVCEGGNAAVNISILGQIGDRVEVYYSDKLNPTIGNPAIANRVYTNFPGNYGDLIVGVDTNRFYTVDSVRYVDFGCTVFPTSTDTAKVFVRPSPQANITSPQIDLCKFDDVDFVFNFPFPGPYTVSYSINGAPTQTDTDVNDGYTVTVPSAPDTTKLVLNSLVYRDIPQCVSEDVDSLTVFVNDTLQVMIVDTLCNDSATGYRFVVDFIGGQPSSYTFTDNLGTVTTTALVGPRDTLPELPNGNYDFTISDGSGCPAVNFAGNYVCECLSVAGVFTNTTTELTFCEDIIADARFLYDNALEFRDANDTLVFVVHDNPGNTLGTILSVNNLATFQKGSLLTNQTYYISAVVADARPFTANGFDRNDRCIDVSVGVPFRWLDRSTLEISLLPNDSGFFCEDNLLEYRFDFTTPGGPGTGNFDVTWEVGGVASSNSPTSLIGISSIVYQDGPLTADGFIEITNFTDNDNANTCYTVINNFEAYTLQSLPDASFNPDPLPGICGNEIVQDSEVATYTANAAGAVAYDWTFENGTPVDGDEQVENVQYNVAGNNEVTLRVTNNFGCIDSTTQIQVVTVAEKPILNDANLSRICIDTNITFVAGNLITGGPGQNSDQVRWFLDGTLIASGGANSQTYPTFDEKRPYEVVVENSFNGCTARDTFFFTVIGPEIDEPIEFNDICADDSLQVFLTNPQDVASATWTIQGQGPEKVKQGVGANLSTGFFIEEGYPLAGQDRVDGFVEISSTEGCSTTKNFSVTVFDVSVSINHQVPDQEGPNGDPGALQYCEGYADSVFFNSAPVGTGLTYEWNFGRGQAIVNGAPPIPNQVIQGAGPTSIVLTATDVNGCTDVDSVNFNILERPEIFITTSADQDTVCSGLQPISLIANGIDPGTWAWELDTTFVDTINLTTKTKVLRPLEEGIYTYSVIGRDANFCYDTTTTSITAFDLEDPVTFAKFQDLDTTYALGYDLPVDYGLGNPAYIYEWTPTTGVEIPDFGITNIYTEDDITYRLTVTDAYNCFPEREVFVDISLIREATLDVPDAFTPNGDGVNDFIFPDGWAISEVLEFKVFNRNGNVVWVGTGTKEEAAWDGTYKGQVQPADTYYFTIRVQTLLGTEEFGRGQFSIIR